MLKQYLIIIVAFIIIGSGFIYLQERGKALFDTKTQLTPTVTQKQTTPTQRFTSSDGRVSLVFPEAWYIIDTTASQELGGQFGPYLQTWSITSYPQQTDEATLPPGGVKIDFSIEQGGGNLPLESLVDCGNKTLICERVGINNELFIKSIATLNTGMRTISVATFYDQNILKGTAVMQSGQNQTAQEAEVNKILNSIAFNQPQR